MGRIVCDNCDYDGKAKKRYRNPDNKIVINNGKDKHAEAIYFCPRCDKEILGGQKILKMEPERPG